jgi:hypothetical protein
LQRTIPGHDIPFGGLRISPSITFTASWSEGGYDDISPFESSKLLIKLQPGVIITERLYFVNITVFADNGISIFCGFPDAYTVGLKSMSTLKELFYISSSFNDAKARSNRDPSNMSPFVDYPRVGSGCLALENCNGNGDCDYCFERCICHKGFGFPADNVMNGRDLDVTCNRSNLYTQ